MPRQYPPNWDSLRLQVFEMDGYACRECGDSNVVLHCHHLDPAGPHVLRNLITLCEVCHCKRHPHLERARLAKVIASNHFPPHLVGSMFIHSGRTYRITKHGIVDDQDSVMCKADAQAIVKAMMASRSDKGGARARTARSIRY